MRGVPVFKAQMYQDEASVSQMHRSQDSLRLFVKTRLCIVQEKRKGGKEKGRCRKRPAAGQDRASPYLQQRLGRAGAPSTLFPV